MQADDAILASLNAAPGESVTRHQRRVLQDMKLAESRGTIAGTGTASMVTVLLYDVLCN